MEIQIVFQLLYIISQYLKKLNPLICFGITISKDIITLKFQNEI